MAWKAGDLKSSLFSGLGGRKGPFKQMRNPSVCHFSLKLSGGVLVASGVDVFLFFSTMWPRLPWVSFYGCFVPGF